MSTKRKSLKKTNKKANKTTLKRANSRNIKAKKCAPPNRFISMVVTVIFGVAGAALISALIIFSVIKLNEKLNPSDAVRFAAEYSNVGEDNVFVYRSGSDVTDIIEHGTGVVFLGFPSCPWCQAYAKYLNEVAKEVGVSAIYYHNIYDDWQNNTEDYQKLTSLLSSNLQYDENGNRHLYVPDAVFVVDGHIVANDLETSKDTDGQSDPTAYWTEERVNNLKTRLKAYMNLVHIAEQKCDDSSCDK